MPSQENGTSNGNGAAVKNGSKAPEVSPPVDISIALQPNDSDAVPAILKGISSFGDAPAIGKDETRLALLAKARDLVRALESPRETMIKHCWAQVCPGLRGRMHSLTLAFTSLDVTLLSRLVIISVCSQCWLAMAASREKSPRLPAYCRPILRCCVSRFSRCFCSTC
jgi:hypothetical protein